MKYLLLLTFLLMGCDKPFFKSWSDPVNPVTDKGPKVGDCYAHRYQETWAKLTTVTQSRNGMSFGYSFVTTESDSTEFIGTVERPDYEFNEMYFRQFECQVYNQQAEKANILNNFKKLEARIKALETKKGVK